MKRLVLALCLLATAAQGEQPVCSIAPDHELFAPPQWYGIYHRDDKIGHAMVDIRRDMSTGDGAIVSAFELVMKVEKDAVTIREEKRFAPTPPHRLIAGTYQTSDQRIDYRQLDDGLHLTNAGVTRVWRGVDRTLCAEDDFALYEFLESEPAVGDRMTTVEIDVETLTMLEAVHTVDQVSTRKVLGADHVFHEVTTSVDGETMSYRATSHFRNGVAIGFFVGPFEFRRETEDIARRPNVGVDLFAEFEKRLDRPLTDLGAIERLRLKLRIDDPAVTIDEVVRDDFLQRVDYLDDKTAILTVADYPAPDDDRAIEAFLKATPTYPADHPRIKALSAEILAGLDAADDAGVVASTINRFVGDFIENVPKSPYDYNTTSVFDILDNRTGDCTEHSQLFITLARAAGLPARAAKGYVYGGDDNAPTLAGHVWVEVLVDGRWTGLDPTWGEVSLNKSHVQTRNDLVPGLTFEVLDVAYD